MCNISLTKSHPESGSFQGREILYQRLQFLMIKYIRLFRTNVWIINRFVNRHSWNFYPLSIFPITAWLSNLSNIYFRIEISCKSFSVVTRIAIYDIQIMHFIKIVLVGIGCVYLSNAWVKSTTQKCHQSCRFKTFLISPLPTVFKLSHIFRFIIGGIQIMHTSFQTCIHDGQILIGQCNIYNHLRSKRFDQFYQF